MNKLYTIYKFRRRYYAFCFDTEIQGYCENFMSWFIPYTNYWMASEDMFKNGEANLSIDKKFPHNYLIYGKWLNARDVHVHKNGQKFTL